MDVAIYIILYLVMVGISYQVSVKVLKHRGNEDTAFYSLFWPISSSIYLGQAIVDKILEKKAR